MPYLSLPGSVHLFYELLPALEAHPEQRNALNNPQTSSSTPSSTSTAKPTLIILSPLLCDITSRAPQARDLRLRSRFNIVCLDLRSQGRTKSEVKASFDHGVAAADIAFAMEALQLPPSFLFAPGFVAFRVAVKFALLFPQQVAGLAFAGICGMFGTPSALDSFEDLDRSWLTPKDIEDYEEALTGLCHSLTGGEVAPENVERVDEAFSVMARRYNPKTAHVGYELMNNVHWPSKLTPEVVATISVPVLVVHGDCAYAFTEDEVDLARNSFTGSTDLEYHVLGGGAPMLWTTHADAVTARLATFLTRQLDASPPANTVIPLDLRYALSFAAKLAENPRVKLRNPRDPESYSARSAEEKVKRAKKIEELKKSAAECKLRIPGASDPETWVLEAAPPTARPKRRWRYSRRHDERAVRGDSLRQSVADGVVVAVELTRKEDIELESESGGSTCSSLPVTPVSSSPPVSYVQVGGKPLPLPKPLPVEPSSPLPMRI